MHFDDMLALWVAGGLTAYLLYALIRPERF